MSVTYAVCVVQMKAKRMPRRKIPYQKALIKAGTHWLSNVQHYSLSHRNAARYTEYNFHV
jgi:hypothetical protein